MTHVPGRVRFGLTLIGAGLLAAGLAQALPAAAAASGGHRALARYSQAQLRSVMTEIPKAQPWASVVRPVLSQWYTENGRVVVGLTRITAAARAAARRQFSAAVELVTARKVVSLVAFGHVSKIVHIRPGVIPAANGDTRRNDKSPFFGGDEVISYVKAKKGYNVAQCTTSFDGFDSVNRWNVMITAGHCWSGVFNTWYSGYISSGEFFAGDLQGTIDDQELQNGEPDAMTLTRMTRSGAYGPHVFTGSATSSASIPLVGSVKASKGMHICTDGLDSGAQICGPKIVHTGMCVVVNSKAPFGQVDVCGLAEATFSRNFCISGDSGGPVYQQGRHGRVYAIGTIDASTQGEHNCFINQLSTVLSTMNARLVTS